MCPIPYASEGAPYSKAANTGSLISADEVEKELNKPERGKRPSSQGIILLLVSLGIFAATGLLSASWMSVSIIVVVLFIHESGHWLGMKFFGYRDLQMFFVPFFGAAVTGKDTNVTGERRAIVALLGPVPGIILGIISGFIYLKWRQPVFLRFGITALFINGLNLLPIYPLDGGQFMETVIFSRHPAVEIVFKSLAVLALAGLALWLTSIPFGILAFATLFLTREAYYQNKITCRLREILKGHVILENQKIPEAHLKSILPELSIGLTAKSVTAKALANRADSVWRRLSQHAPKFWPSFALLAVYVGTFIFGIGGTFVLAVATNALNQKALIVQRMTSDGKTVQVEERYWKQVKIFEAQLNEQGLYDGPSTTWTRKGVKRQEGFWAKGYWQGEWKNYDSKGNIESIVTYDNGRPHKYQIARSGAFVEVTPEQWPMAIKYSIQASPTGTHVKTQAR